MKLIDILVEELPKRGGWPKRANCITQDGDLKVEPATCHTSVAKCDGDGFWRLDSSRIGCFEVDTLASDYTTAVITREQYEAALAAKNEGWIDWGGGECPVSASEMVDVIFGHGGRMSTNIADCWRWNHSGTSSDIIAYRLHQPQQAELVSVGLVDKPIDDDCRVEEDLNECIGQAPAPLWNGEGLIPPVGCECEMQNNKGEWIAVDIIAQNDGFSFGWNYDYRMVYFSDKPAEFRAIQSEAERKRDAAVEAIDRYMPEFIPDTPNDYYNAKKIYDAIAAGKIPGVKLDN